MRLSLEALETLDAIAEQGSFARAAESLHRVPSALTYTVKKLESDLGVTLFDRSGQRARLTELASGCWPKAASCCAMPKRWSSASVPARRAGKRG